MSQYDAAPLALASLKVAFVTNSLPPYRISKYNEINKLVSFTVLTDMMSEFIREWDTPSDRLEFDCVLQRSISFTYHRRRKDIKYFEHRKFHLSEKTISALRKIRPNLIVSIEFGLKSIWCLLYGAIFQIPVIVVSEGTVHSEGHVGWIKKLVRKVIVSQCERFWCNGVEGTNLLVNYGADRSRVDVGMTGIDTVLWRDQVRAKLPQRDEIREKWHLKGKVLMFSGALSERKGLVQLALALERWLADNPDAVVTLLIIGDGDKRKWLEQWAKRCTRANVIMPGFVERDELTVFSAAADWAVLPTLDDNWPLACLETTIAGLPQIFSSYNGATCDLYMEGTGVVVDPLDQESFMRGLNDFYYSEMGRIPDTIVEKITAYYSASEQAQRAARSFQMALKGMQ